MNRDVYEVDDYDLGTSGTTKSVPLNRKGPISIQPTVIALVGNPTYTVEVSNDNENFVEYHKTAKNVPIDEQIWIAYEVIPWAYLRFNITRSGPDAGTLRFKLSLSGE